MPRTDEEGFEACGPAIVEHEERIEELVLKLDLVGRELSEVYLPPHAGHAGHEGPGDVDLDEEAAELDVVAGLDAARLRTLCWSFLDDYSELEFQKRLLHEKLRRKEAEATALEQKCQKLERQLHAERQGFHERLTSLHSERIEFAQAVCSPTGKKSPQDALRALNADLEVISVVSGI